MPFNPNFMPFTTTPLNDGNELPQIAFGTGSVNKGKDMTEQVEQAIEAGFWHIDTAQAYRNEESVGRAIRESGLKREELFITGKYITGNVREVLESSLRKLGVTYLDLYLVHAPPLYPGGIEKVWRDFEKLKADGLAKSIGVSNFSVKDLQTVLKVAKVVPAVNQIEFHPYIYAQAKPVLDFCSKHGIVVEGYSPLTSITKYPGGPVDKPVEAAAARMGVTPAQVLFLWVISKGMVIVTTSSKRERLQEYLAVGDLGPLTNDEIFAIEKAASKGPISGLRDRITYYIRIPGLLALTFGLTWMADRGLSMLWGH